jgi:5-methylcytosine-specific restriction protein B
MSNAWVRGHVRATGRSVLVARKYDPLAKYLGALDDDLVEMTFDQIAELVGPLPRSAYEYLGWWSNNAGLATSPPHGWIPVGWRVLEVDQARRRVTFAKETSAEWRRSGRRPVGGADLQRAWLIRGASVHGRNLVPEWVRDGYCSVAAPELREVSAGLSRAEVRHLVDEDYAHQSYGARSSIATMVHAFLTLMKVGDVVVTTDDEDVYVGTITSEPYWVESQGTLSSRRRNVDWAMGGTPLKRRDLSETTQGKLKGQQVITDITSEIRELTRVAGIGQAVAEEKVVDAQSPAVVVLPDATDELAGSLLLPKDWLQDTIELLAEKRQIVFYGPPGTGKTYVARKLAEHLARIDDVRLVQFHPSYSYEDFFEGFRPRQSDDGSLAFGLVPGPFRKLVEAARENPARPHVLIIDEINRANLASVFGELYFLLEYRDEPVELLYSSDADFRLPRNVYIIGTMNTADRSIALVDAAMRRRFAFQAFFPGSSPVDGLLRKWLARESIGTHPADLLDELNARIDDKDFAIGPSYLMNPRIAVDGGLERVWRTAIMPLLEEHYFGQDRDVEDEFGLAALNEAIGSSPSQGEPPGTAGSAGAAAGPGTSEAQPATSGG